MKKLLENLGWIGLAVALAGLVVYSLEEVWTLPAKILAISGAAIFVAGLVTNYQRIIASFKKRSTLLGFQSLFSVVLVVAILGLINFLGQRHTKRWDMTSSGQFSLSEQTQNILGSLKKDIAIKAFFEGGEDRPAKDLLMEYKSFSSKLSFEFVDPNKKPQVAKQYEVKVYGMAVNPLTGSSTQYGTVIIESNKRIEKIEKNQEPLTEQDLTNAIIKVTREGTKTIYFLEGHGEKSIDSQEPTGMSKAKAQLEKESFVVKSLNLVRENAVPADCSLLAIAGATTAPFPQEMEMIKKYLESGGSLILLMDPEPAPGFIDFLKDWGVTVGKDVVLDASGLGRLMGAGPEIPLVTEYSNHRITQKFGRLMTFYPLARSVTAATSPPSGITVEKLFETNPRSWGETGDLNKGPISFDEGKDLKGPVSLAVAVAKNIPAVLDSAGKEKTPAKKARIVAVGDSDFCRNAYFADQGNGNLFMNMANWLAADEDLISIRPKDPQDKRVFLSSRQRNIIFYLSVVALPLMVLVAGVSVWLRRKRL